MLVPGFHRLPTLKAHSRPPQPAPCTQGRLTGHSGSACGPREGAQGGGGARRGSGIKEFKEIKKSKIFKNLKIVENFGPRISPISDPQGSLPAAAARPLHPGSARRSPRRLRAAPETCPRPGHRAQHAGRQQGSENKKNKKNPGKPEKTSY